MLLILLAVSVVSTQLLAYDPYADDEFEESAEFEAAEEESVDDDSLEETAESNEPVPESFSGPSGMAAPLTGPEWTTPFWDNTRLSVFGSGFMNLGDLSENLPVGYTGGIAYEAAPRLGWVPELRFEAHYIATGSGDFSVAGPVTGLGLLWLYAPLRRHKGRLQFVFMPGVSFLSLTSQGVSTSATKMTASLGAGYEYPIGSMFAYAQVRYRYIYDSVAPLQSTSVYAGFGMHLKATPPANKGGF